MAKHLFYKTLGIDLDTKKEILEYGKSICYNWWVDEIDCSKSLRRVKVDMSFDDIMSKLDYKSHFTIIHRRGSVEKWYIEIGFHTMTNNVNHYLWVCIDESFLNDLVMQFNLEEDG